MKKYLKTALLASALLFAKGALSQETVISRDFENGIYTVRDDVSGNVRTLLLPPSVKVGNCYSESPIGLLNDDFITVEIKPLYSTTYDPVFYYTLDGTDPVIEKSNYCIDHFIFDPKGKTKITVKTLSKDSRGYESIIRQDDYSILYKSKEDIVPILKNIIDNEKKKLDEVASVISKNYRTDLEKTKYAYDWILDNVGYGKYGDKLITNDEFLAEIIFGKNVKYPNDINKVWNFCNERHSGIINNRGEVKEWAKILSMLLNRLNIENNIVEGHDSSKRFYAWNQVKLNGEWYNIDAFGQKARMGAESRLEQYNYEQANKKRFEELGHGGDAYMYGWFLISDDSILGNMNSNKSIKAYKINELGLEEEVSRHIVTERYDKEYKLKYVPFRYK